MRIRRIEWGLGTARRRLAVCLALGFTVVSAARASDLTADKVTVNDTLFVGGSNATWNVTSAIMGQWHMDDNTTNTTVTDSSGRSHPGTLTGGNTVDHHASGHIGTGALALDGANDYILVPDNNDFDFGTNSFSISAWINPAAYTEGNVVDKTSWDTYYPQFYLKFASNGKFQFLTYYQDYSTVNSAGGVSTGVWSHIVAVRNCDGRHQIYINGQLDTESTLTPRNVSNTYDLAIGCESRNKAWKFNGKIDEVCVFNKALTAGEVRGLYNEGSGKDQLSGVQYGIVRGELIFQGGTNRIDGCLSIGTNQPSAKLHVNGTIRADQGVVYSPALGDLPMGSYTNSP